MKTNSIKIIALFVFTIAFSYSQAALHSKKTPAQFQQNQLNPILFENEQIVITLHLEESANKIYGIISILNKTSSHLSLTYEKLAYYNGQCSNQNSPENSNTIHLPALTEVAGSSSGNTDGLRIFHSFKSGGSSKKLTALSLVNIQIEKI